MILRGTLNRHFTFLGALGLCASALTFSEPALARTDYCQQFSQQAQALQNQAVAQGLDTLSQPIVVANASNGLTDAQAQAQSNAKIDTYKGYLARAQALLNQYAGLQTTCSYWTDAYNTFTTEQANLQILLSYNGPYTAAESTIGGSVASVSNSYPMPLPCHADESAPNGLRPCSQVIADTTTNTEKFLLTMISGIYRGCDIKESNMSTDPQACISKYSTTPVCNYFEGFTGIGNPVGQSEQSTNHLGQVCNKSWATFSTRVSGRKCNITNANPAQTTGVTEQSYFIGNEVRALDCHWAQVKNELVAGKLNLTAATGQSAAAKYKDQIDKINSSLDLLKKRKNLSNIENCDQTKPGSTGGEAFQSACQLYTHRALIEKQVAYLAAMEVLNRAQRSFERWNAGTSGTREFFADFQAYLKQNDGDRGPPPAPTCYGKKSQCSATNYLSECYQPLWKSFFVSRSNSVWNSEVCK